MELQSPSSYETRLEFGIVADRRVSDSCNGTVDIGVPSSYCSPGTDYPSSLDDREVNQVGPLLIAVATPDCSPGVAVVGTDTTTRPNDSIRLSHDSGISCPRVETT